jgi:signal transduction histidine kinase/BarA-like signal transduction histidine kinase
MTSEKKPDATMGNNPEGIRDLRILILEDVATDVALIERELRRQKIGFVSKWVKTEKDFINQLHSFTPDLILSDYNLPVFNGVQALAITLSERPEVPFIIVSGSLGEERAVEILKSGATDYVLKDRLSRLPQAVLRARREATERRERRRAQRETARLEAQLSQAQKMQAIGTLAGGIAHDFNNILSAIMGYTEVALMSLEEGREIDKVKADLEEVLQAGKRARSLIRQILTFSRQAGQESRPVQVSLIINETLKMLRASLPTTIEIQSKVDIDSGFVWADPSKLHQVVMNLCTNAYHAVRQTGGVLGVKLMESGVGDDLIETYPHLSPGPYLKLSISDNGHGMEAGVMERIFEPYFTTKGPGEGNGLGLAVVHGIVTNLGGAITVNSEIGRGTTFKVYLPRINRQATQEIASSNALPKGKGHILFVDDEGQIVRLGERLLAHLGYQVTTRTSGMDALEVFRSQPDTFDLVITDLTMPQMTGIELARELLRLRFDLPIILCTGFSEAISADKAKIMGIREYLLKPVTAKKYARTIRRMLHQEEKENKN